jgi:hypothetical protein
MPENLDCTEKVLGCQQMIYRRIPFHSNAKLDSNLLRLTFAGCRDGVLDLAKAPEEKRTNGLLNKVTCVCLPGFTRLIIVVTDFSFVVSFGGATLGNALIYLYPALMFRGAVKKMGD